MNQESANLVAEAAADVLSPMACISSGELMRFQRLLDRTAGVGFKLVMWEAPTAADREALRAWLAPRLAERSIRMIDVDLVRLFGRTDGQTRRSLNVWSELRRCVPPADVADHRAVLVLSGFEEFISQGERGRSDLLQQFNIQRDILVRDYPCWWLLLIHPASRQQWYTVAPDFSDFVALWIESPLPPLEVDANRLRSLDNLYDRIAREDDQDFPDWPPELRAAHAAVRSSRLDSALDAIYSFRLATTSQPRTDRELAIADLIEGDVISRRGRSAEAMRLWRDRALPTFQRLGLLREQCMVMDGIGDALDNCGNLTEAQRFMRESLAIRERLAQAEPDRADYQRDISVTYRRMGDLYRALGQLDSAREAYLKSLAVFERLAQAEPDRADYQRDLSLSYGRVGDLYRVLGQMDSAHEMYRQSLAIARRLTQAKPNRTDYQRALLLACGRVGDLERALGHVDSAHEACLKSLAIAERLTQAELDRSDYQRDLSVSYNNMGDLYSALGQRDSAREAYVKSLAIFERLAQAEPDRADYQRDLSVAYNKVGDVYRAQGQLDSAREAYLKSLAIFERLAQAEPDRADYQRDLVVSHWRMGIMEDAGGETHLKRALAILVSMKQSGRLNPADEPLIDHLRELLRQRGFDPS